MSDKGGRVSAAEARAAAEARQRGVRAQRQAELDAVFEGSTPGLRLIHATLALTVLFTGVSLLAVIDYRQFATAAAAVALGLFLAGVLLFPYVLWVGAQRSRDHTMGIGGWFFLAGTAPRDVQVQLLGALGVQTVVGIGSAIATVGVADSVGDQATKLAFGTLVPVFGLAVTGLWAARHGVFPPRETGP